MGLQKVAFNFMVERGGKLAKSLLCTKPQKAVTNINGLRYSKILEMDTIQFTDKRVASYIPIETFYSKNLKRLSKLFPSFKTIDIISKKSYLATNGFPKLKYRTVKQFLEENPNINLEDFCRYANSINYENLQKIVPEFKNYTPLQKLHFANHHYPQRKLNFCIEDLQFKHNLTQYLKENYTNAYDMLKIYSAYPTIKREVGSLPSDWSRLIRDTQSNAEN